MNKNNLTFKMIFVLTVITTISGLVLSGVWSVSRDKIKRNEQLKIEAALYHINPETKSYTLKKVQDDLVYQCLDADGNLLSYFFIAKGNGFQALIKLGVGVDINWKSIKGIRVLEQTETPGLGAKITADDFLNRFKELILQENKPIACVKKNAEKTNSEILGITGATISSKAVVNIINDKISILKYLVN